MRWHVSDTSEQEAFLGQMCPEGEQAWEAALGLGLTEDHKKILPGECESQSVAHCHGSHLHFIISFWEHGVNTAPVIPHAQSLCAKRAFLKLVPMPAEWSLGSLSLEWQIRKLGAQSVLSHLLLLSCWLLQPQLQLWAAGDDTSTLW